MTAALDLDLSDIHTRPTMDMKPFPLVDVGPLPGACEQTFVGQPPPERLPYARPACILPSLDELVDADGVRLEEKLSDLAANVAGDSHCSDDDLWTLMGSKMHVRAIAQQLGATEMALASRDERIERLGQTTAQLSTDLRRTLDQLTIAQGVAAALQRKLDGADRAVSTTAAELYAERNRTCDLELHLRVERQRLEREAILHNENMTRLIKRTAEVCRLQKDVARLTEDCNVLRAALEKCERGGK
jgi:hypothetical protein